MKILVIGAGYVGLVTAACFAEMGHLVTCLDIDREKIALLQRGASPIYEPGLEALLQRGIQGNRLFFTDDYEKAVDSAEICFIAVSTPSKEDGSCDLNAVFQAATRIAAYAKNAKLIVIKSTVPVGTCAQLKELLFSQRFSFEIVSNPEFLKEGSAINDCMKPDRVIVGVETPQATALMRELYASFTVNHDRIFFMDPRSAEMVKYAANAMLATRISFMNELSGLCEKLGADINEVRIGIGSDKRIGYDFLYAGIGYGGSCFPKDLRALQAIAKELSCETPLLDAVETINQRQKKLLSEKIQSYFNKREGIRGKTIAIWGLSFKPETDDIREAPSLELIKDLLREGAHLRLYDPISLSKVRTYLGEQPNLLFCSDEYEAAQGAHAIALVTEWKQFRFVDFAEIQKRMDNAAFFDGRNQYKAQEMKQKGFDYFGIGIPRSL
jgi:UDPglucose 6-dehydrogenase